MKGYVGIDCGSAACKGILLDEHRILSHSIKPTGWSPRTTAKEVMDELLSKSALSEAEVRITATGYGRIGIGFAHRAVTEITCHARGAEYILPGVRTVIDIGGQDSKVISEKDGKVTAFQMNDKCAAGTGRFLEMSAHRMGLDMGEFAECLEAGKSCSLNSMCAVFADSEIVSLLAAGKSREEIAGGVVHAVVARTAVLTGKLEMDTPVLLTGGLSDMKGLRSALEEKLGCEVQTSPWSRYAGAIGAALISMSDSTALI